MFRALLLLLLIGCAKPVFCLPVTAVSPQHDFLQRAQSLDNSAHVQMRSPLKEDGETAQQTLERARQRYREIIKHTALQGERSLTRRHNLEARRLLIASHFRTGSFHDRAQRMKDKPTKQAVFFGICSNSFWGLPPSVRAHSAI